MSRRVSISRNGSSRCEGPDHAEAGRAGVGRLDRMAYRPLPVKTSTTGPKILTAVGVLMLIATIAVVVVVVQLFLSVLPTGIVSDHGAPGPEAAGGTQVPGTATLHLEANTTYVVYLAQPSSSPSVELSDQVEVITPSGQAAGPTPVPGSSITVNAVSARSIFAFLSGPAGEYTITAPPLVDPDAAPWATVVVAPGDDLPSFFGGLFGTISGVFLAIGLGVVGLIVTTIGAIWWYTRRKDQRRVAAGQHGPAGPGGPGGGPGGPPGYGSPPGYGGPPPGPAGPPHAPGGPPPPGPPQPGQQPGPWA